MSSAGLIIPVVLRSDIIGLFKKSEDFSLFEIFLIIASWISFLISIGASALYSYVAIKYAEYCIDPAGTYVHSLTAYFVKEKGPGIAYGIMVASFYIGAVAVVFYCCAVLFL